MNDQYSVLAYYRETRLRTLLTQCRRALVWVNLAIVSAILVLLRQTLPLAPAFRTKHGHTLPPGLFP